MTPTAHSKSFLKNARSSMPWALATRSAPLVESELMSTIAEEIAMAVTTPVAERLESCRIGLASGIAAPRIPLWRRTQR